MMRKNKTIRIVILLLLLLAIAVGFGILALREKAQTQEERDTSGAAVGRLKTIELDGKTFVERKDITTLLLIGTDITTGTRHFSARSGGQADFLMLLVIDDGQHKIHQLAIDRDTMTAIKVLSLLGDQESEAVLQICLSHAYGESEEECCENTVDAVSGLFEGLRIDGYFAVDLENIGRFNHALGGVTVTLEDDDFAELSPRLRKGETVTLTDEEAEMLVHTRMTVGGGTNEERMRRQAVYLRGATQNLRKLLGEQSSAEALFVQMESFFTTNVSRGQLINIGSRASGYTIEESVPLQGEHRIGDDGFVEFHLAEGEIQRWLTETVYELSGVHSN